jgi:hypothetical protein
MMMPQSVSKAALEQFDEVERTRTIYGGTEHPSRSPLSFAEMPKMGSDVYVLAVSM